MEPFVTELEGCVAGKTIGLFAYLQHSIIWLDECGGGFANFHLVFLMRLSRFLGLYPNLEDYHTGDYFDLLNACFTSIRPQLHSSYINPEEAARLRQLMRMNYETMHLFILFSLLFILFCSLRTKVTYIFRNSIQTRIKKCYYHLINCRIQWRTLKHC